MAVFGITWSIYSFSLVSTCEEGMKNVFSIHFSSPRHLTGFKVRATERGNPRRCDKSAGEKRPSLRGTKYPLNTTRVRVRCQILHVLFLVGTFNGIKLIWPMYHFIISTYLLVISLWTVVVFAGRYSLRTYLIHCNDYFILRRPLFISWFPT